MKKLFPIVHNVAKFFSLENLLYKKTEPLQHIIDNIYLGDFRAADSLQTLNNNNITHIINCAYNLPNKFPETIKYYNLNLEDIPSQNIIQKAENAYKYIKDNSNNNILIHCVFGASRSGATVMYYLMKEKKWTFDKSYEYIKSKRSALKLNQGFEQQLREFEKANKI